MAFDKVIDSAKLDSAITATANAIRLKTGTSEKIQWDENSGFASAVEAITVGGGSSEDSKQIVMEEHTFTGFEATAMPGVTAYEVAFGGDLPAFEIVEGQEYVVVWDDTEWTVTARDASVIAPGALFLGNGTIAGLEQNGEPFAIGWHTGGLLLYYYGTDVAEHKVSIYKQAFVGSLDDLRYVTFMNDDGTVEYGKKAVATGDDCADPIARGIFGTPTKESTAQYNYTFSGGWATVPNGGIDENALIAVNEDRTVYTNFISAVRYYTVTYYDSDGTTVLKTESLAYGKIPSYVPEKDGFAFEGWIPSPVAVSGNASYTAQFVESVAFADASWETIAARSADGTASKFWSVGDIKTINYNGKTTKVLIAGFNHDELSNGNKIGITLIAMLPKPTTWAWSNASYGSILYNASKFAPSTLKTALSNNGLDTEILNAAKYAKKKCDANISASSISTITAQFWLLAKSEIEGAPSSSKEQNLGEQYECFQSGKVTLEKILGYNENSYLRTLKSETQASPYYVYRNNLGNTGFTASTTLSTQRGLLVGFCI